MLDLYFAGSKMVEKVRKSCPVGRLFKPIYIFKCCSPAIAFSDLIHISSTLIINMTLNQGIIPLIFKNN